MENTDSGLKRGYAVCLDIGGTSIKSGVIGEDGIIVPESMSCDPVDSSGSKEQILGRFAASLAGGLAFLRGRGVKPVGMGIAIGGPFDYENGISKIKDLDKYEALYNVNVKKSLQEMLHLDNRIPLLFDVDGWAFGRGEVWAGAARGFSRVIVFTMGTGVGSAFAVNGKIVSEGAGVPWCGWVAGQKYRDGILNDYISRTFMIQRYIDFTGEEIDVDEMAARAEKGDRNAAAVFTEIGKNLGEFLRYHNVPDFKPECLVFGGQISRAFRLFSGPIKAALADYHFIKAVVPAEDIERSALKGVAKYVFEFLRDPVFRPGNSLKL